MNYLFSSLKGTSYKTPCSLPKNANHFGDLKRGEPAAVKYVEAQKLCASCLVRIECLADDINSAISESGGMGNSPKDEHFSAFCGGVFRPNRLTMAEIINAQGAYPATLDTIVSRK